MSFFSTLLTDVENIWSNIFGKEAATISADVVEDIQLIGSGLGGALSDFEALTGVEPAVVAEIQNYIGTIEKSAESIATTIETNIAQPIATQIAADFASLQSALAGVTLPAALQSVLNAVQVLLPYIEAGVGILTAGTVDAAQAVGLSANEARLILKAK